MVPVPTLEEYKGTTMNSITMIYERYSEEFLGGAEVSVVNELPDGVE